MRQTPLKTESICEQSNYGSSKGQLGANCKTVSRSCAKIVQTSFVFRMSFSLSLNTSVFEEILILCIGFPESTAI